MWWWRGRRGLYVRQHIQYEQQRESAEDVIRQVYRTHAGAVNALAVDAPADASHQEEVMQSSGCGIVRGLFCSFTKDTPLLCERLPSVRAGN